MFRLVLFDIDGTLLHTNRAGLRAFDKALAAEFNLPDAMAGMRFAGRTDSGLMREIFVKFSIEPSKDNFAKFFDSYVHWLHYFLELGQGHICPGVHPFIDELQRLQQPPIIGLLTGNIRLGAELKLRHFNLWDYFATGAFADDAEDRGHIAAIAHKRGSEMLGETLRGEEVLVIGDTPLDISCARFIGAKVLAVATGISTVEELKNHQADWVAEDLTKVNFSELFEPKLPKKRKAKQTF